MFNALHFLCNNLWLPSLKAHQLQYNKIFLEVITTIKHLHWALTVISSPNCLSLWNQLHSDPWRRTREHRDLGKEAPLSQEPQQLHDYPWSWLLSQCPSESHGFLELLFIRYNVKERVQWPPSFQNWRCIVSLIFYHTNYAIISQVKREDEGNLAEEEFQQKSP